MFSRISNVSTIDVKTISFSSSLQIGDCGFINGHSKVLAMHRRTNIDTIDDIDFTDYPIFDTPAVFLSIQEPMHLQTTNLQPYISVGTVKVIGISSASLNAIGNIDHIQMQSQIKNIRKLSPPFKPVSD
jgi:spore germination protein PE